VTQYLDLDRWRGRRPNPGVQLHTHIYVDVFFFVLILLSHRFLYVVSYKSQQKAENVEDITGCHRDLMLILIRLLSDGVGRNRLYC
jgi:hypothetical protein